MLSLHTRTFVFVGLFSFFFFSQFSLACFSSSGVYFSSRGVRVHILHHSFHYMISFVPLIFLKCIRFLYIILLVPLSGSNDICFTICLRELRAFLTSVLRVCDSFSLEFIDPFFHLSSNIPRVFFLQSHGTFLHSISFFVSSHFSSFLFSGL
jgi:hypothetical protein